MHTQVGMKIYLTLQEVRGEGNKQWGRMMEGRAMRGGSNLNSTLLERDRI